MVVRHDLHGISIPFVASVDSYRPECSILRVTAEDNRILESSKVRCSPASLAPFQLEKSPLNRSAPETPEATHYRARGEDVRAATAAICPARVATNVLQPVVSSISRYFPLDAAARGETRRVAVV